MLRLLARCHYYEYMPSKKYAKDFQANVVKSSRLIHISKRCYKNIQLFTTGNRRISINILAYLASIFLVLSLCGTILLATFALKSSTAYAEDTSQNPGIVATDSITDTENLLGDYVTKVSDAIASTKKSTGVTVKLLYLSTFGNSENPSKWASDLLISTLPTKNTVLLAVATHDGRLVVAVSPNSDEWLKNKNTVDALSDAAYKPLVSTNGTRWAQSAIMMMNQIVRSKRTSTTSSASLLSTIVMLVILLALCALVTFILLRRQHIQRQIKAGLRKARRRHARKH